MLPQLKIRRGVVIETCFHSEEEARCCFAEQLASLGNIYVNDALNCSQSACSTTIIAQFLKNASITIGKEIESLNKVLKNSENR
jgi:phosphoglycerate kinase